MSGQEEDGIKAMAVTETAEQTGKPKSSKLPLILGLLVSVIGGGAGFYLVYSGIITGGGPKTETPAVKVDDLPEIGFVALDPLVISLGPTSNNRHLRFTAQLEVEKAHVADLETLRPRVVDVLNSYLRALEIADLEDPGALTRIRAQMLRRIQIVAGEGRVRDVLIMEFVLN